MRRFRILCIALTISNLIPDCESQVIAQDGFTNRNLGSGVGAESQSDPNWLGDWLGSGATSTYFSIVDPAPALSYSVTGGGVISGGNRALQITTSPEPVPASMDITRKFTYPQTTVYVRFLLRIRSSGTGTDLVEIGLRASDSEFRTVRFVPLNPGPPFGRLFFLKQGGGFGHTMTGDLTTTHLIVYMIGSDSTISYWINPSYTSFSSPTRTENQGGTPIPFNELLVRSISTDGSGPTSTILIDELCVGYTWADVVPAPANAPIIPTLDIDTASRIRWQSINGKKYQVQYSYNLTDWFNFGSQITGNGHILEVFDSRDQSHSKFYRVSAP